jgi:hypothetical protein
MGRALTLMLARFFSVACPPLALMLIDRWFVGMGLLVILAFPAMYVQVNVNYALGQLMFWAMFVGQAIYAWKAVTIAKQVKEPEKPVPPMELR